MIEHAHPSKSCDFPSCVFNRLLMRKPKEHSTIRWFSADDTNKRLVSKQKLLLFHADATLIANNASPFRIYIDPNATLDDIVAELKQSEAVAAAILRGDRMFKVIDACIY